MGWLTIQLSGLARRRFRAAERAIYCEDGAATMTAGPLERIVRWRLHSIWPRIRSQATTQLLHMKMAAPVSE
jgi:hypothetical protein